MNVHVSTLRSGSTRALAQAAQPDCPAERPTTPPRRRAPRFDVDYVLAPQLASPSKYPLTTVMCAPVTLHLQLHPPTWCLAPTPCTAQYCNGRSLVARGRALVASAASASQAAAPAAATGSSSMSVIQCVPHQLRVDASLREVASVLERVSIRGARVVPSGRGGRRQGSDVAVSAERARSAG